MMDCEEVDRATERLLNRTGDRLSSFWEAAHLNAAQNFFMVDYQQLHGFFFFKIKAHYKFHAIPFLTVDQYRHQHPKALTGFWFW